MQAPPADVVVLNEGEHLGFAGVSVVGRHVQDLLDIARERRPSERRIVVGIGLAPHDVRIVESCLLYTSRCV